MFGSFTWEQCLLGNVAKITMGQSPNSENYTENPSDYILVQGNADMKEGRVVPRVWTTQVTKTADKGDLILSVRAPVGDIGKTISRLAPMGKVKVNGFIIEAKTNDDFVDEGTEIKIIEILKTNVLVERI